MSASAGKDEFDINQIWESLLCHPDFRKQRALFAPLLGNSLWWLATVRIEKGRRKLILNPATHGLWQDSRLPVWPCKKSILKEIAKYRHTAHPFDITCPEHGFHTHCIPIVSNKTDFHVLAITHIDDRQSLKSILHLLYSNLKILLKCVLQEAESKRLEDSLKPRMVALSTVHTVHRLINTTLSLNELYQRLSRLTAQVLRVSDCSIFIRDKGKNPKKLYERGRTGLNITKNYKFRVIAVGESLEGRVFSTAKHVLRKNILSIPMIDEDVIGVMTLKGKKDSRSFDNFDREILMTLAEEAVVAIKNAELYEDQKRVTYETIQSLSKLLDTKFSKHRKISARVLIAITDHVCRQLKIGDAKSEAIMHAVRLKNASKLGMSDEILNSSNRLTHAEQRSIHQHPVEGAEILSSFQSLKPIALIVMSSHEKYDGSGYPAGQKGRQIPIGSRILAILNAFDALITGRPYQAGMDFKEAVDELSKSSGTQFDPEVLNVFKKVVERKRISTMIKKEIFSIRKELSLAS